MKRLRKFSRQAPPSPLAQRRHPGIACRAFPLLSLLLFVAAAPALAGEAPASSGEASRSGEVTLAPPIDQLEACRKRLLEVDVGEALPTHVDRALESDRGEVITPETHRPPDAGKGRAKGPKDCFSDIRTFVRAQQGTTCDDLRAEIAGWSEKCVKKCDPATRLAEANASAAGTCAAFCRTNGCRTFRYVPRSECGASDCLAGLSTCDPKKCPLFDSCYLLQGTRVWNCDCLEITS